MYTVAYTCACNCIGFRYHHKLCLFSTLCTVRTPPKQENPPFLPPLGNEATPLIHVDDNSPHLDQRPPPLSQPSELNRVQILQVHSSDVKSSEKEAAARKPLVTDRESLNVHVTSHHPAAQQGNRRREKVNEKRGRQDGGRGKQDEGRGQNAHRQQLPGAVAAVVKEPTRGLLDEFMPPPAVHAVSNSPVSLSLYLSMSLSNYMILCCALFL